MAILHLALIFHRSLYGFLVLNIWWPPGLSIVMNVNCSHGEKISYANLLFQHFVWCPLG
jgi:hypothetical protein